MPVESAACRVVDLARVAAAERGLGVVWTRRRAKT
jgi:hypothetical protein